MPILINFKICDNAQECGGVEACGTGALYWDKENKKIGIDNSKCTNCGLCVEACPVEAIHVAKTDEEYEKIKKEIESDERKISDLFVDRYGAQPVSPDFLSSQENFDSVVDSVKPCVVELFNDDSIECLLRSIPIDELFKGKDIRYKKVEVKDKSLLKEYNIKKLPALVFFKDGKMIGKIEGYFEEDKKEELKEKIEGVLG